MVGVVAVLVFLEELEDLGLAALVPFVPGLDAVGGFARHDGLGGDGVVGGGVAEGEEGVGHGGLGGELLPCRERGGDGGAGNVGDALTSGLLDGEGGYAPQEQQGAVKIGL